MSENTETPTKAGETERSSPVAAVVNTSEEPFLGDLSRGAKVFRAGAPPTARQVPSQAAVRSEESWERSRISVRRITTAGPLLQAEGRAGRREDLSDEPAAVSSPAPAAASQQQHRGRVRLNASTLGLYQKNHPSPRNASPLSAVRGGGDESGQLGRPGVGAAALRADRVRFKVR